MDSRCHLRRGDKGGFWPALIVGLLSLGLVVASAAATPAKKHARGPDLIVRFLANPTAYVKPNAAFTTTFAVANRGPGRARASVARAYLSRNIHKSKHDRAVAPDLAVPALKAGKAVRLDETFRVPSTVVRGPWYVIVCADISRRVAERNERNNCRTAQGRIWLAPPPPAPPPPPPPPSNNPPTDIGLSGGAVAENQPAGTNVGALSTTDPDAGDTFTYSLVAGAGATDNAKFQISGSQLRTSQALDFEAGASLSVRIQTSDGRGGTFQKAFAISVTDANDAPSDITLSSATINENQPSGTAIGTLAAVDQDVGQTHTFALAPTGCGGGPFLDNAAFSITGNSLVSAMSFDFEAQASYTICVRTTDGGTPAQSFDKQLTIHVLDVDEAPTDIALSGSTVPENQPSGTTVGTLSATDPDAGDTAAFSLVSGTGSGDNGSFTISGNTLKTNAVFDFETKSSYSIRVRTTDSGSLSFEKQLTITVTNANDPPTDLALSNASVPENQPSGTSVGTFSTTDPDSGDTFAYSLVSGTGSGDNGSFTISGNTLKTNAVFDFETKSSYSIRVRTTDSGSLSFEKQLTITVTNANDPPTDLALSNASVTENQPAGTTVGTLSATDQDVGDSFTYSLVSGAGSTDNGSFTISGNTLQTNAVFDFETKASYSIRVRVTDSGAATFEKQLTITVADADDPPVAVDDSATLLEDAGATPIDVLANDTDQDTNPAFQLKTVTAKTNGAHGTVAITGGGSGVSYTPAADYCGLDSFTYTLNGGSTATVSVTVTCVNDAPSFTKGPDQTNVANQNADGSAKAYTIDPWATGISAGPANESSQAVDFVIDSVNPSNLFTVQPAVSASGALTFTTNPATIGTATITLHIHDDGGTANGGVDTSATQSFTIQTVPPPPVAVDDSYTATGNVGINVNTTAEGVLQRGTDDQLFGASITNCGATNATTTAVSAGTCSTASASGGDVVLNTDGTFDYEPPAGFTGTDHFFYKLTNAGGTSVGNVSITVGNMIWFVKNDAAACTTLAANCGRLSKPLSSLAAFQALNTGAVPNPQNGDTIFLYTGTGAYTGGVTLRNGQLLIGQGASASITTISGITLAPFSNSLPATGGTSPSLTTSSGTTNAITLGSGNTVRGLDLGNRTGSALGGTNFGTLTLSEVNVTGSGQALSLNTGTANAAFGTLSSSSGTNGVSLTSVSGSLSATGGSLSGAAGDELAISGGGGSLTYPGAITKTGAGSAVNVTGKSGGTVALSGQITDSDGTGSGVSLTSNTGATVNLSGGLTLSTGANPAYTATGGGTVTVTGSANTLGTTTATALNVANTTIGASGLTFRSINAGTGSASSGVGISLDSTGSGGLTVTGNTSGACGGSVTGTTPNLTVAAANSADCSGGQIQHKTGADGTTSGIGIYLNNTGPVSLTRVWLHDFDNFGIYGTGVSGLTVSNSLFNGSNGTNQNGSGEGAIYFFGLSGSASVTSSSFSGGALDTFHLENDGAQVLNRITFTGDNFGDTLNATSASALFMQADCSATLNMTVGTSVFTAARANNLNVSVRAQTSDDLVVSNSEFSNGDANQVSGGSNLALAAGGPSSGCTDNTLDPTVTYDISNNTFRDALGTAISISKGGVGTGSFGTTTDPGVIDNNVIGVSSDSASSGAGGIGSILVGGGSVTNNITNNTIHGAINGINVGANSTVAGGGQGYYRAVIQGNTVDTPNVGAGNITNGLLAQFGSVSTDDPKACLTLGGSTAALKNSLDGGRNGGADLRLRVRFGTLIGVLGYSGANNDDAAMTSFLSGQNTFGTAGAIVTNNAATGSGWTGSCPA